MSEGLSVPGAPGIGGGGGLHVPIGAVIGGVPVGSGGLPGTYQDGFRLAGGTDFNTLDLLTQGDATGSLIASHRRRGRRAISDAANDYYWSADHTGYRDAGRGVAIGSETADLLSVSNGVINLGTRLATTAEKALAWPTSASSGPQRPQAASSIHAAGYQAAKWPCIIEARVLVPTSANMAAADWPAFWCEDLLPTWANTGEWDWEWKDTGSLYPNFITGTSVNDTTINGTSVATADGAFHVLSFVATAATLKFYIDGVLVATSSKRPDSAVTGPMFWWARNGVDLTPGIFGMTYSAAAWSGKTSTMQIDWVRIWTQPGSTDIGYKGVVSTINVDFGAAINATLPTEATLWGTTALTEYLITQPIEDAEPGMSQTPTSGNPNTWYGQTAARAAYWGPTFCAWNRSTRAFTGSGWDRAGRMVSHLAAWDDTNGGLAGIARVVVNVGPNIQVPAQGWANGAVVDLDLYPLCDVGVLLPKTISVSGLPSGLTFNAATGHVTGTISGTPPATFSVTCVNSLGQTATKSVATTSYPWASWDTLVGDFRPDTGVTLSGSNVTGVANQKAGGGDLTTSSGTGPTVNPPVLTANAKNGLPAFTFASDKSTAVSGLVSAAANNVSSFINGTNQPFTLLAVYDATDLSAAQELIGWSKTVSASDWQSVELILRGASASGVRRRSGSSDIQNATFGSGESANTWRIFAIRCTGTAVDVYDTSLTPVVTGAALSNTGAVTNLAFSMGAIQTQGSTAPRYAAGTPGIGMMGDVLVATSARSTAEIQASISALAARWGITLS